MSASPDTGSPKRPNRRAVLLWLFPLMLVAFGMSWRQNQRRREPPYHLCSHLRVLSSLCRLAERVPRVGRMARFGPRPTCGFYVSHRFETIKKRSADVRPCHP